MLMSEPMGVPVSAADQQLPVGLSGEIISRSQIGHEFAWPKSAPRSQWQPQRTDGPSDDAPIRRLESGSRLLPYHGIAVLLPGNTLAPERMEIRHEITVIGNPSFTRVVDEKGLTQFYEPSRLSV